MLHPFSPVIRPVVTALLKPLDRPGIDSGEMRTWIRPDSHGPQ